ncbi:MAG TPA: hypothetical protein VII55_03510 [Candidatus Saccharimonadales bacterium]
MTIKRFKNTKATARAIEVMVAIVIVVGSVAFAALQSQQDTLSGNTIETATADLRLSTDDITYSNSHTGFDFNNLVPGGQPVPTAGYSVYLRNMGGTPLALKLALSSIPTNPNHVDLNKVTLLLTKVGGGTSIQSFSLQSLMTAAPSGGVAFTSGNLDNNNAAQYKLQIAMDSDAITGSVAALGNIDFVFSGTAQSS